MTFSRIIGAEQWLKIQRVFIFCDGSKFESDRVAVDQVRDILRSQQCCGTVQIVENVGNLVLSNFIIADVIRLCDKFGRLIALEDDFILSRLFFGYMNSALDLSKEGSREMQVPENT